MTSEQEINIKFVLEVENYPCLYNYKLPEYVRKDVVDKAWAEIGKKFNITAAECKEKWRNIRNVFVRNLRPGRSGAGAPKKRPYYLNEVMQFTLPFIKLNTDFISGNLPQIGERVIADCVEELSDREDSEDLPSTSQKTTSSPQPLPITTSSPQPLPITTSSPQPLPITTASPQQLPMTSLSPQRHPLKTISPNLNIEPHLMTNKKGRKLKNVDEGILDYLKAKQARTESLHHLAQNPRKMFLLSLVPDIEAMSDGQIRKFKKGVLQMIEDILEEPSSSSLPLFYDIVEKEITIPPENNDC